MIRRKGRYRNQTLELDQPLDLPEGAEVEIEVRSPEEAQDDEKQAWSELGMSRLEEEWDNPQDAIYDDWKKLYGVPGG
jgi:predicted DNA-binding antitoxin AbrB/MazE fold protein